MALQLWATARNHSLPINPWRNKLKYYIALMIAVGLVAGSCNPVRADQSPSATGTPVYEVANAAYRLAVRIETDQVNVTLDDKKSSLRLAEGPYFYKARLAGDSVAAECRGLTGVVVGVSAARDILTIHGKIAGLDVEHVFELPANRPIMEERFLVLNTTGAKVALADFEAAFERPLTDATGAVLPELAGDRFVAVPFRVRPEDGKGARYDFPTAELIKRKGYEVHVGADQHYDRIASDRRQSDGWAWTHGAHVLGISKFDQENMQWSVLAVDHKGRGASLRFGGVAMIDGEPSDLGRIEPGKTVRLGVTRYQTLAGGYQEAMYAFRDFLDENGCRFPKGFNPPVHWEQLYDMNGAWDDRLHRYTKAILEKEAAKGVAYSCEALYLDPGWDTGFATFLWGDKWLGPRKDFVEEMKSKYGLKVSLHTPLAPWMSVGDPMGPDIAPATYPAAARRKAPTKIDSALMAPALADGRRNLALLPEAKANASSVYANGSNPKHQVAHLNDGKYGNDASWIAKTPEAWAEIDLGASHTIFRVRLSNDHTNQYSDRQALDYRVLAATEYDANSQSPVWKTVAKVAGEPLAGSREFSFAPCAARWVRVQIDKSGATEPRLDEIEIYEDQPLAAADVAAWNSKARHPAPQRIGKSTICIGSKAYQDEAAKRLLDNCADGIAFVMFDGNEWQGGSDDPTQGHPVPFTKEDHMRANLELARRVHAKYPDVLIEMHDMMTAGSNARNTPVYYKYGLPGSYDDNWGFEFMWNSMADILSGKAVALYYYNLSCNVPVYLHINLKNDNPGCLVLWWYASTCRHLGIGGTNPDPAVVKAEQAGMRKYHELERFFKRGDFYGINEEVHLHALPAENAFVANLFNLSGQKRVIGGSIELARMGLKADRLETSAEDVGTLDKGVWTIHREMQPWSSQVVYVQAARP